MIADFPAFHFSQVLPSAALLQRLPVHDRQALLRLCVYVAGQYPHVPPARVVQRLTEHLRQLYRMPDHTERAERLLLALSEGERTHEPVSFVLLVRWLIDNRYMGGNA